MPTSLFSHLRSFAAALLCCGILASPGLAQDKALRNVIDTHIRAAWQREKIAPAPRCDDATFLRRIYLDLVGCVPSYEETKAFLDESATDKRSKLIDKLLAEPRFARHQANTWDHILFGRNPPGGDATRKRDDFKQWLTAKFAKDEPFDQLVRGLLLAEEGSEMFYVQYRSQPEEATVAVSRVFLGTQLQCARCHDHPYERWTQRDFYGMAGFFVRLVVMDGGTGKSKAYRVAEKTTGEVLFSGSVKEQRPGQKGEPVKAKYLGGAELKEPEITKGFKEPDFKGTQAPPKPLFSRKEKLAEWVTAKENPYFTRALANRVWAQLMGRGIVHPIDDLNEKNDSSHPELLEALTKYLLANKYAVKQYIREVVNSEAYQVADTGPTKDALPKWFERARVRPLTAEELMASFRAATGFPTDGFKGSGEPTEYFLRYFGEPNDGQGNFQGSLSEHLFLNNSSHMRLFAQQRKGNLADTLLTMKASPEEKVDRLFLSVLSRLPSAAERQRFVQHLSGDAKMAPALVEEAVWVLLCCSEFRFNH